MASKNKGERKAPIRKKGTGGVNGATALDVRARTDWMEERLIQCQPWPQIRREFAQHFKLDDRSAYNYRAQVHKLWSVEGKGIGRTERRDEMRQALCVAYRDFKLDGEAGAAMRALDLLVRLDGLAEPTRTEVKVSQYQDMSVAELEELAVKYAAEAREEAKESE
jgi:hypothetical protein